MVLMNPVNDVDVVSENYQKANSFGVIYDDMSTFSVDVNLQTQITKDYAIGFGINYTSYDTEEQRRAWNLPNIKANLSGDFKFDEKWFGGINLFYIGERYDILQSNFILVQDTEISLNGFFDANANIGYNISERFTAFVKANNITNQKYQNWQSYPVQGIKVLGGLTYKFDF